jgi:hypothetical protein
MPVMAKRGGQEEDSQDSSKLNSQGLMLGLGLKADFQSSHEAPRSSLRVLASN